MQPFTTLTALAVPLDLINVDTDMIIPKQFLKTIKRTGLGVHLFDEMRYDDHGKPIADFVLNQSPYTEANILVAGDNFGCGSSREHAPWALNDFGIRCIIAPSFADIFYNNCFKNGMLPIRLPQEQVNNCMDAAKAGTQLTVDLETQTIVGEGMDAVHFEVESFRKHCLLNGLDDIGLTLAHEDKISSFESEEKTTKPWLFAA
jgi:3-isopropylmalate/(R)-2-methylmalate dehydratase small subunit